MNKEEFDAGYKAFIDHIKNTQSGSGNGSDGDNANNGESSNGENKTISEDDIEDNGSSNDVGGYVDPKTGNEMAKKSGNNEKVNSDSNGTDWEKAVDNAISKMPGNEYSDFKDKIGKIYKVKTDWKKELKNIIGRLVGSDNRLLGSGFLNKKTLTVFGDDEIEQGPKIKDATRLKYIVCVVDTSGSMSKEQIQLCISEIYSAALAKKPMKLMVIQCDNKVNDVKEFVNMRGLKEYLNNFTAEGRGGTDVDVALKYLITDKKYIKENFELVVLLTDGYISTFPKRNSKRIGKLLWCITGNPSFKLPKESIDANTKVIILDGDKIK